MKTIKQLVLQSGNYYSEDIRHQIISNGIKNRIAGILTGVLIFGVYVFLMVYNFESNSSLEQVFDDKHSPIPMLMFFLWLFQVLG